MEAEEALARRRKVVSELEVRSKATALQAASLEQERAQLSAVQVRGGEGREMTDAGGREDAQVLQCR